MAALSEAPIGLFDSGIGGLTVAREIMKNLPNEQIVYFGDTARLPYGNKSRETVIRYSRQIMRFLMTQHIKAIVIACNTASAMAIDSIKESAGRPVIGVVKPGAYADLAVWREEKFRENVTYMSPHAFAAGMEAVLVNGVVAYRSGSFTGNRHGKFLERN